MSLVHGQGGLSIGQVPLLVDASGRPLVTIGTALPAGANLIGRVDGRNGDKLASLSAVYASNTFTNNATAGTNTLTAGNVPASTLRHLTAITVFNANSATTRIDLFAGFSGIVSHLIASAPAGLAANVALIWTGHVILRASDNFFSSLAGCTLNDDITMRAAGWDESI